MARVDGGGFPWKLLLFGALAFLFTLAAGVLFAFRAFHEPGPHQAPTVVLIDKGQGLESMAQDLEAAGVIASTGLFEWGVRLAGAGRALQAGEYRIPARASMAQIMALLRAGTVIIHKLTVPEGVTSAQVVALVNQAEKMSGKVNEIPPEGRLLPETYHYTYGDSRTALVARMREMMEAALSEAWRKRASNLPFDTREEALILASIVEKETAVPAERAMVAGVFVNRLRRGMPLQSDPTVIYALSGGKDMDRALTRADLDIDSAYNTYRHRGLPPTPIANPGLESLHAAVNPMSTDALYFVADGTGGHTFATSYEQHQENVRKWRAIRDDSQDRDEPPSQ